MIILSHRSLQYRRESQRMLKYPSCSFSSSKLIKTQTCSRSARLTQKLKKLSLQWASIDAGLSLCRQVASTRTTWVSLQIKLSSNPTSRAKESKLLAKTLLQSSRLLKPPLCWMNTRKGTEFSTLFSKSGNDHREKTKSYRRTYRNLSSIKKDISWHLNNQHFHGIIRITSFNTLFTGNAFSLQGLVKNKALSS